jgi:hypothetical protein
MVLNQNIAATEGFANVFSANASPTNVLPYKCFAAVVL